MTLVVRVFAGLALALLFLVVIIACDFVYVWLGDHVTPALHLSDLVQRIIMGVYLFVPMFVLFLFGGLAQRMGLIEGSHGATLTFWFLGFLLCGANYFLLLVVWLAAAPRTIY